jgi:hypothetical protein
MKIKLIISIPDEVIQRELDACPPEWTREHFKAEVRETYTELCGTEGLGIPGATCSVEIED